MERFGGGMKDELGAVSAGGHDYHLHPADGPIFRAFGMILGAGLYWFLAFALSWLAVMLTLEPLGSAATLMAGIAMGGACMAGGYHFVYPHPTFRAMLLLYLVGALSAWGIVLAFPWIWIEAVLWAAFVGAHVGAGIALFLLAGRSSEEERRAHALVALCLPVLLVCAAWVVEYYEFDPLEERSASVEVDGEWRNVQLNRVRMDGDSSTWYLSSYDVQPPPAIEGAEAVFIYWPYLDSSGTRLDGHRVEDPEERALVRRAIEDARGFRDLPFLPRRPIDLEGEAIFRFREEAE